MVTWEGVWECRRSRGGWMGEVCGWGGDSTRIVLQRSHEYQNNHILKDVQPHVEKGHHDSKKPWSWALFPNEGLERRPGTKATPWPRRGRVYGAKNIWPYRVVFGRKYLAIPKRKPFGHTQKMATLTQKAWVWPNGVRFGMA